MSRPYFHQFEDRFPPPAPPLPPHRATVWHLMAGLTIGLGVWYICWRWSVSLNPDAIVFSVAVAAAETLSFAGTLLFFHDIWDENDTPTTPPPDNRADLGLEGDGSVRVDLFITTFDEEAALVAPSLEATRALRIPTGVTLSLHLLDDGNRAEFAALADRFGARYHTRHGNRGFKAGNLKNALFATRGDFIIICDADTRILPGFVEHTLGYFRDPRVAWVQTPHWFYDIPPGESWRAWLTRKFGARARVAAPLMAWLTGRERVGEDPFLANPGLFFDVVQRRRNRNHASFCCGAGSIHRREALFDCALKRQGDQMRELLKSGGAGRGAASDPLSAPAPASALLARTEVEPFRFHVSEDIHTSILQHADGWRSVYHPQAETRMLSPWSMRAWKTQQLKYAGGTFDIILRANPLWRSGMGWRIRLHYAATFWSYLSVLWIPVLLLAPVFSLLTGIAPVAAYSAEFFLHILPILITNELALILACKGHDIHSGRILSLGLLPLRYQALGQVLRGRRVAFPPTPKTPARLQGLRHALPNLLLLGVMAAAGLWGVAGYMTGQSGQTAPFLVVNLFWLMLNANAVNRAVLAALWQPPEMAGERMA